MLARRFLRGGRASLFVGAIPSPLTTKEEQPCMTPVGGSCAWCYRDAGLPWPQENPTSTICAQHSALLLATRRRLQHSDAASAATPLATPTTTTPSVQEG